MHIFKSPVATKEIQEERQSICNECPALDTSKNKCNECGCYLAYKIPITIFKCPLKKW